MSLYQNCNDFVIDLIHTYCCTCSAARILLHVYCCTRTDARVLLHVFCCTYTAARVLLHAYWCTCTAAHGLMHVCWCRCSAWCTYTVNLKNVNNWCITWIPEVSKCIAGVQTCESECLLPAAKHLIIKHGSSVVFYLIRCHLHIYREQIVLISESSDACLGHTAALLLTHFLGPLHACMLRRLTSGYIC